MRPGAVLAPSPHPAHCSDDNTYFNNTFNVNGTMHKAGPGEYLTNIIGNASLAWLESVAGSPAPFFAYIAPHGEYPRVSRTRLAAAVRPPRAHSPRLAAAPHVPATPAHEYENAPLPGGVDSAPRTPNWDYKTDHHHWLVSEKAALTPALVTFSDQLFARRLRATMSVDDILADVLALLAARGVLADTYFFYTSDHGYDLGQFRLPSGG